MGLHPIQHVHHSRATRIKRTLNGAGHLKDGSSSGREVRTVTGDGGKDHSCDGEEDETADEDCSDNSDVIIEGPQKDEEPRKEQAGSDLEKYREYSYNFRYSPLH